MKSTLSLLIFWLSTFSYSQNYISLDSLKSSFEVKEYSLNTQKLYGKNRNILVYNVFITPKHILLLSVLPELTDNKLPTNYNWRPVEDNLTVKPLSKNELLNKISAIDDNNSPNKKTMDYSIIRTENGKQYVSRYCLTELFLVDNFTWPLAAKYGTINISENKVSVQDFAAAFSKKFPQSHFPLDPTGIARIRYQNGYAEKFYLSKELRINNLPAYQFWTLNDWYIHDGYEVHRGIDRFVYMPDKGIVGGSYDFWFATRPTEISLEKIWSNILNERLMIAEEIAEK